MRRSMVVSHWSSREMVSYSFTWEMSTRGVNQTALQKNFTQFLRNFSSAVFYMNNFYSNVNYITETFILIWRKWPKNILSKPKWRTYMHIKQEFGPEPYITYRLYRSQRSLFAQLRAGIFPLVIEVGRFKKYPGGKQIVWAVWFGWSGESVPFSPVLCKLWWFKRLNTARLNPEIFCCSNEQKLEWLFNSVVFKFANFLSEAWKGRQDRCLISIYPDFSYSSVLHGRCFCQWFLIFTLSNDGLKIWLWRMF